MVSGLNNKGLGLKGIIGQDLDVMKVDKIRKKTRNFKDLLWLIIE